MQSSSLSGHARSCPLPHSAPAARRPRDHLLGCRVCSECTLTPISSYLFFMAMAVAIDTARLALDLIPYLQKELDGAAGGQRRFQVHRISAHATILFPDSEIWRQLRSEPYRPRKFDISVAKQEALDWQADPDDNLDDAAVLYHLHQQAATVPILSNVISQNDHGSAATTLTGSALSASINAKTQGRLLSSFHRFSCRISSLEFWKSRSDGEVLVERSDISAIFPPDGLELTSTSFYSHYTESHLLPLIVWAGPTREDHLVFWQLQLDFVDLFSWRALPTSRPEKRQRTAFNPFLQVSQESSRGNPLPHARRFNGVRHRPDRKIWVAEMKPPKHKTKQDFGNFKSEAEAARAVDAAFYHYGKPQLLNFPDTSLQFLSTRPTAPPGLDKKAKVKFVKKEAKLLLAAMAASSSLHSTHTNSLQIPEPPRRCPSGYLSEISWPLSCSGPDEFDDAVQPWMLLDSTSAISTTGLQTNLETLNSVQISRQGWDWTEESTLTAPPNVVNLSACEKGSMWLDSLIQSPPAPMHSRSPSPSGFQDEIAYALVEQ